MMEETILFFHSVVFFGYVSDKTNKHGMKPHTFYEGETRDGSEHDVLITH